MASDVGDVNNLIASLEGSQLAGGETLYVNDAGEFRTAAKGFWSWVSMRTSGFDNDAVLVAQRISALVSNIGDLAPHFQRLKPALDNFNLRILKAKKQPVREARSKAMEGAFVSLGRYSPVPARSEASPFVQIPASTRSNTPNSSLTPRSDGSGSPHSVRSFGGVVPQLDSPPAIVSREVSQFDRILNDAVTAAGQEFGFTEREKGQLRQSVAQLYSSGEVVENEEIPLVVGSKARELATKRNLDHFKYGYLLGQRVCDALEKRFGNFEFSEGWVKSQAALAKTTDEFNTILWNEAMQLAKKKLTDVFDGVCLDAGFSADRLPFSHEKAAMRRLFELQKRILTSLKQEGVILNPQLLKNYLWTHFARGNNELTLKDVIAYLERQGLYNEHSQKLVQKSLSSLFPDGVFRFPAGIVTEASLQNMKPKQTYLTVEEQEDGTFTYTGDRNFLGDVIYSPDSETGWFIAANRELLAKGARDQLLLRQTEELGRHTITYEKVDSIRPLTQSRIREVWVHLLIEAAQESCMLPPNLTRQVLQLLEARILAAAKDRPIEELGWIARQEINKLK